MNRGRVLVVDDLEQWREQLVETLQHNGFYAESASTAAEVLLQLGVSLYHLIILDIRLADSDPSNFDGIALLQELEKRGLSEATKVIMLSSHDTKEHVRMAFRDYKVADFLSKDKFTEKLLLDSVQKVFSQEANINLELDIQWQQVTGPEQVVLNLEIAGTRIRRDSSLQGQVARELNDLLCRLFFDAEKVLARPLAKTQSKTAVLHILPVYAHGTGRAVIVKFGDFHKIEQELNNFKEFVQPFIGGGRNTTVLAVRRTPHLGGIVYSLLGASDDQMEDFGSYYRHADAVQINKVLDWLFLKTCRSWYANPGQLRPYNLTEDYQQSLGFTTERIEHTLVDLQRFVQGKQKLRFKSLSDEHLYTNPLLVLSGPPAIYSTYICPTHGDFNQTNILVDTDGHTWLIDFQRTGLGHILRDIAQLDSSIRFVLLKPDEATLEERRRLEEILCSIDRFSQVAALADELATENRAVAKVFSIIIHLRMLAHQLMIQNSSDDMNEYYCALFYNAVNATRYNSLPRGQREHALLCASILADRLGPSMKG